METLSSSFRYNEAKGNEVTSDGELLEVIGDGAVVYMNQSGTDSSMESTTIEHNNISGNGIINMLMSTLHATGLTM